MTLPQGFSWDPALKMGRETAALNAQVWPSYLLCESDLPEPGLKFEITHEEWTKRFPVWGIRRDLNGELAAFANAALVTAAPEGDLPADGWTYAIRSAGSSDEKNCLCLLSATVSPTARGLGLAHILVERAKEAARELGFQMMIAPVRPTLKHQFPFATMKDYVVRKKESGELFDPWLNLHQRAGGELANICPESVKIRASIAKWKEWTGLPISQSGERLLPQGLVPLKVDLHRNLGVYCEPNVWFRYRL